MPHPQSFVDSVDRRWDAVLKGLRLANSFLGIGAIGGFYALWGLIGLILCLVFIPFAILGRVDAFTTALNPVAKFAFVLPLGLMAAATWAVNLASRLLWCAIPEPLTARGLAGVSVAGRISVLIGAMLFWRSHSTAIQGLLHPEILACSGIAWLGLLAEWGFVRTLRSEWGMGYPSITGLKAGEPEANPETDSENPTGQAGKGVLTRDVGEWFAGRFPQVHRHWVQVSWFVFPLLYVTVFSLADNGSPEAAMAAVLRLMVVAPALLQVFWIQSKGLESLIDTASKKATHG